MPIWPLWANAFMLHAMNVLITRKNTSSECFIHEKYRKHLTKILALDRQECLVLWTSLEDYWRRFKSLQNSLTKKGGCSHNVCIMRAVYCDEQILPTLHSGVSLYVIKHVSRMLQNNVTDALADSQKLKNFSSSVLRKISNLLESSTVPSLL